MLLGFQSGLDETSVIKRDQIMSILLEARERAFRKAIQAAFDLV